MAIKKRLKITQQADRLADELADKAYGTEITPEDTDDQFVVTSISIPQSMLYQLEDIALRNKRSGSGPKNISALIREALKQLLVNN